MTWEHCPGSAPEEGEASPRRTLPFPSDPTPGVGAPAEAAHPEVTRLLGTESHPTELLGNAFTGAVKSLTRS